MYIKQLLFFQRKTVVEKGLSRYHDAMNTMVQELRVMSYVSDLVPLKEFYETVLGYRPRRLGKDSEDIFMVEHGPGRVLEYFQQDQALASTLKLSLQIEDVHALWRELEYQVSVVFPLRHNDWGDTSFAVQDPVGTTLIFFTRDNG